MTSLSAITIGPQDDRRIIGYVDDLGGVYDIQQRRVGGVGMEHNGRYAIQDPRGVVIGSVESSAGPAGGHAVYDNFNAVIGSGFTDRFEEATTGQVGLMAYNAGRGEHAGLISSAALLLLVHSPVSYLAPDWKAEALDHTVQESRRMAHDGIEMVQTGVNRLMDEHTQTLMDRERRAKAGSIVDVSAGQRMKTAGTIIVEMIPLGLGPWGIGDVITFIEGAIGRTLDGLRLSNLERLIYFGASAIPVVPARPVVTIYRIIERGRAHEVELREAERREVNYSERLDDIPTGSDLNPFNLGAAQPASYISETMPAGPRLSGQTGQWETCQVEAHPTLMNMRVHFTAEALGPRGVYTAATSRGVATASAGTDDIKQHGPVVNDLVKTLMAQGWEPISERGPYWFSYRFRRRVH